MRSPTESRITSVNLPVSLVSEVDQLAGRLGLPRSGLMREALVKYLDSEQRLDAAALAERVAYLMKVRQTGDPELRDQARAELLRVRDVLANL